MKLLYLILILISYKQILGEDGKKCDKLLNELKQAGSLFFMCSMHFSVPVTFCTNCVKDHAGTVEQYKELINASYHNQTTNETEICKETYFDQDRLNIVQTLYDEINGLWERAYCNECYDGNGTFNNLTYDILNQLNKVNGCLLQQDPCYSCRSLYLNLNDFYTRELEKKSNNEVCFDLQDAMNRTRYLWSKKLHCCDRVVNLTAFAAVSSVIAFLPILFYITMYFYTKRVERNHDMLIDYRTETAANNNITPVNHEAIPDNTTIINTPVPGRSTREAPETSNNDDNAKKNFKNTEIDSDDDDDISLPTDVNKQNKLFKYSDSDDDEPIITKESPTKTTSKQFLPTQAGKNVTKNERLIDL